MRLIGKLTREEIGHGEDAVIRTVRRIQQVIRQSAYNARVRQTAEFITRFCASHDDWCVASTLYEWVRRNVKYRFDPTGIEYVKAPHVMLQEIEERKFSAGDCDDMTALLAALLKTMGMPVELLVMSQQPTGELHHIYLQARIRGSWVPFDPISLLGIIGVEPNATRRIRFAA